MLTREEYEKADAALDADHPDNFSELLPPYLRSYQQTYAAWIHGHPREFAAIDSMLHTYEGKKFKIDPDYRQKVVDTCMTIFDKTFTADMKVKPEDLAMEVVQLFEMELYAMGFAQTILDVKAAENMGAAQQKNAKRIYNELRRELINEVVEAGGIGVHTAEQLVRGYEKAVKGTIGFALNAGPGKH